MNMALCSGQQNPDSGLDGFSAFAGGTPSLKVCGPNIASFFRCGSGSRHILFLRVHKRPELIALDALRLHIAPVLVVVLGARFADGTQGNFKLNHYRIRYKQNRIRHFHAAHPAKSKARQSHEIPTCPRSSIDFQQ